jgi:hypothetical protein
VAVGPITSDKTYHYQSVSVDGVPRRFVAKRESWGSQVGLATRRTKGRRASDSPSNLRLRLYEFEKIGIDLVCMGGRHPVRQALIDLQRAVLQELGGQRA